MNKYVAIVHERKKPFYCGICEYNCSQKNQMNKYVASVHEGKKPFAIIISTESESSN